MSKATTKTPDAPVLRFPNFSEPWSKSHLKDLVEQDRKITYGIVQPGKFVDDGIPLVRGGDYSSGWAPIDQIKMVTKEVDAPYKRSKLAPGDLLMTIVGANTGTVAVVPEWLAGANITQTTARISIDKSKAVPGFIEQALKSPLGSREVRKYIKGAAQPGLNLSDVERFSIPTTSRGEQEKISSFLRVIDDKINLARRQRELIELYKKSCLQNMFRQELRLKDQSGKEFPAWEKKRLSDLVCRVRRKNDCSDDNVLTISAQSGLVSQMDYFNHSVSAKDLSGYYRLLRGEFAYNKSYSRGYPLGAIKRLNEYESGVVSTLYICFSAANSEMSNFLEWLFESQILNRELARITQEGARNHGLLNMAIDDFFGLPVSIPSKPERLAIVEFLNAIQRRLELADSELSFAVTFKQGLLQSMFV
ncbi:restriction endonuclease subunit S [Henriciella sp.]|uniref:restriction endonuclease subunit S n=1 Tax=Henriciella sp. TaxID=1968823 RepID=UPI002605638E|nr:restriction endonuclease subunit S [Henriciella sp.]